MAAACMTVEWCVTEKMTAETTQMKPDSAVNTFVLQKLKLNFLYLFTPKIYTEI